MGCLALKQQKNRESHASLDEGNISRHESVKSVSDIKITGSMLIQEGNGDPFLIYDILKPLGEGSFGKVYKVMNKRSKNTFALKEINKISYFGEEEEKSLINEINVLMKLDHPNILKVYEYYNTKRKFFIVSELCTGGELFDQITIVKHFNEKVAAHIFKQLLSAVNFCHINNIIHRDLKPENILIENEAEKQKELFTIKVIDFGTSEIFKKNSLLKKRIGTPFYIAPEILKNSYNEKCDLWSCGVILYILLCGSPPFYGKSDEEIYKKVLAGKFDLEKPIWNEVSEEAKDLVRNLLCMDVKKRFSAEQALNHVWFKKMKDVKNNKPVSKETLDIITKNLGSFRAEQKLQQAALAYIVHNLIKKEDCEEMKKAFIEFDENGDGRLTKQELEKGLLKVMTPTEAKKEVDRIMDLMDNDNNGYIEYEEFLRAALNKEDLLTDNNLQQAFTLFDKDNSGKISAEEIKKAFGDNDQKTDNLFEIMIKEIDVNGDGEISFKEFKELMRNMINKK
jgi:calcium-dependent protein kinase